MTKSEDCHPKKKLLVYFCHMFLFLIHCSSEKIRTHAISIQYYRLMASDSRHGCYCRMKETEMKTLRMFHKSEKNEMKKKASALMLGEDIVLRYIAGDYVRAQTVAYIQQASVHAVNIFSLFYEVVILMLLFVRRFFALHMMMRVIATGLYFSRHKILT